MVFEYVTLTNSHPVYPSNTSHQKVILDPERVQKLELRNWLPGMKKEQQNQFL
jgi:hypothetical protein